MRREDVRADRRLTRRPEVGAFRHHELPDALQTEEARVALVQVAHRRPDPERLQRPHPADTEDHLLSDTHILVTPVERVRDPLVPGLVLQHVRVEEVQRDPSDLDPPDLAGHDPVGEFDLDPDRRPRLVAGEGKRHLVEVVGGINLLLPAVVRETLAEVAPIVEKADPDERDAEIARRLHVIAREDAQPARVDREPLADPELEAEVGDLRPIAFARIRAVEPRLRAEVRVERRGRGVQPFEEETIVRELLQPFVPEAVHERDGVVLGTVPSVLIDRAEDVPRIVIPGPSEVAREPLEGRERRRKVDRDLERMGELRMLHGDSLF